jgi:hypothetical protein
MLLLLLERRCWLADVPGGALRCACGCGCLLLCAAVLVVAAAVGCLAAAATMMGLFALVS